MKKLLLLLLLPFTLLGQKPLTVILTTDNYPSETYWILMKDSLYGDTIASVSPGYYTSANTTYVDSVMIADSITNITFLIRDTYGDGIMTPGNFFVTICNDTLISVPTPNFNSGMYWNRSIPNCMPLPPPPANCIPAIVNINLDQFQSETSWDIKDINGAVLAAGGPYTNAPDYEPQFEPVCLPTGNLTFTIYDTYGDGMAGSLWGGQDGSYYLTQCGDTLVYGNIPNFGTDFTHAFISDSCTPPPPIPGCMDDSYLEYNPLATTSDSSCLTLKILGCIDSTMFNYDSAANHMDYIDSCDYTLILHDLVGNGWVGSRLDIYQDDTTQFIMTSGSNQTFTIQLKAPEEVRVKFFATAQASGTALECGFTLKNPMGDTVLSIRPPFLMPFHTYVGTTYCGNECITVINGCMDSTAFNYDSLANTSLPCYYNPGCISPAYLEYHTDTTNGYYTDINIQDSCSTLAVFGCTDSTALNYDSLANVDNGSCSMMIIGCMDPAAYNYNILANVSDSANCLYNANCITGPGNPYWLNDPCYAWVIDVDDYCCENEWDTICQATYDYCEGTWVGPLLTRNTIERKLIKITDILGRPIKETNNQLLFYMYSDGTVEKKLIK